MYLDQTKEQHTCGGCLSIFLVSSLNPENDDIEVEYCPFCGEEIYEEEDEDIEEDQIDLDFEDFDD